MLYIFSFIFFIIPNLYAEKNITSFKVSTIVLNTCKNFINENAVTISDDTSGFTMLNEFSNNIQVKCTFNTNFKINIDNASINDYAQEIIVPNTIVLNSNNNSNLTQYTDESTSLVELENKIKYTRKVAKHNAEDSSFYEIVNITITF